MMAKPATTRGQPRSERKGRPPRPDPPLLRRPLPLPTPETRRRRSLRPRRPLQILKDEDYGFDREWEEDEEEEEEEEEGRGLKKLRLVVKLHRSPVSRGTTRVGRSRRPAVVPPASSSSSSPSPASSSSSYVGEDEPEEEGDEEEHTVKPPKKRKIEVCTAVGGRSGKQEDRKKNISYRSSGNSGTLAPSRSGIPMPDRMELESILDKLQKKDTYGAFAEPVDPEELPDYHDVIEHPMDFGTIRKKLARIAYRSFEQFEDDVFLICSNAMQYNAPDTVYFRQASSIQDMAQKMFQKIRNNTKSTEADRRSEEKVRLNTMEKKMPETQYTQQAQCKAILEPLTSDISSGATLASAGDTFTRLSTVNSIDKSVAVNGLVDGSSSLGESKQEKGDEFSVKCSPSKLGRKSAPLDENRRATYSITPEEEPLAETDLILNLFEDDQKQLVPAGPEAEYSYARSLARFAVSLGPVAWEIVSQKIEKALPPGVKYGPGWVGEYEPLPSPFLSLENCNKQHSGKAISESRAAAKAKVTELKSNAGQNPISSKKQNELKKQLIGGIPRKASVPIESTSCRNLEQKPSFLGADSTVPLRINGTGQEKHSNDSNNLNSGFSNPVNSANCSVASVRVKEESPSEETTERSQVVFCANGKTQRSTEKGLHQKKNHEKRESTIAKAFAKSSQQGVINNPSSNGSHSNLSGTVLREGNHLQTKNQKELPTAAFQTQNNILGMAIGGLSNGIRPNNNFAFSSSNQAGVNYGLGLVNNRDQASTDPFRLVGFSGKVTNQENISSSGVNGMSYLEKPIPIVSSLARENYGPATSNASKAWISAGTAVQWKSVDSKSSSVEPITSPPFCNNSTWKPTTSIQVDGDSMVRPGNLPIQVFDEASNVKSRGLVIFPQLITTDVSKHQSHPPWQLLSPQPRSKQRDNLPPDLNIGYQPPGSPVQQPSANLAMDSQQPDLALQL